MNMTFVNPRLLTVPRSSGRRAKGRSRASSITHEKNDQSTSDRANLISAVPARSRPGRDRGRAVRHRRRALQAASRREQRGFTGVSDSSTTIGAAAEPEPSLTRPRRGAGAVDVRLAVSARMSPGTLAFARGAVAAGCRFALTEPRPATPEQRRATAPDGESMRRGPSRSGRARRRPCRRLDGVGVTARRWSAAPR